MKSLKKWHFFAFIIVVILGSLFHFIYQWSNKNAFIGLFGAVNESTWEHLKLLFWPTLFLALFGYFSFGKRYPQYFYATLCSIIIGIATIIVIFYTYTGIIGENFLIMDISIFIIGVGVSQYVSYRILNKSVNNVLTINYISIVVIVLLIILFITFTFNPLHIPLFKDPISGQYGI